MTFRSFLLSRKMPGAREAGRSPAIAARPILAIDPSIGLSAARLNAKRRNGLSA